MGFKSARLEIKQVLDTGEFTGLAAVFGNVDQGGDLIEYGAFSKTLADKNGEAPILWAHDPASVIGVGQLRETPQGLEIQGKLILDSNDTAQKVHALMKGGAVRGLSVGYDNVRSLMRDAVRHLQELKLYEVSLTAFPMNEAAVVTAVKAVDNSGALRAIKQLVAMIEKAMR